MYWGESSRSAYQRGREHQKEIDDGSISHPLVAHFWDQHNGEKQQVIMRIITKHRTALDRQVSESARINECMRSTDTDTCLNLKTEWGGSKVPDLGVTIPKGTATTRLKNSLCRKISEGKLGSMDTESADMRAKELYIAHQI